MLHNTRGIALYTVNYSETSIIAKIYTELFGLQSYIVKGIRKQHTKIRPGLFQPLTLLDLTVYHKLRSTLHTIREIHIFHPYQNLTTDIRKSSVALFINELIYKSIREEEPNQELFDFLMTTCISLDQENENFTLFPLLFTIRLSRLLGIYPHVDDLPSNRIFNLQEGIFQSHQPDHRYFLDPPLSLIFKNLISEEDSKEFYPLEAESLKSEANSQQPVARSETRVASSEQRAAITFRNELLEHMLIYYKLHLPDFREINSHRILHTVLA